MLQNFIAEEMRSVYSEREPLLFLFFFLLFFNCWIMTLGSVCVSVCDFQVLLQSLQSSGFCSHWSLEKRCHSY